ncbi:MAG: hypothetical protein QNJ94_16970 [Alphaproteobacteria bacterium]|nr:hypothetical protein [Alphaproteobacteria bacterium]
MQSSVSDTAGFGRIAALVAGLALLSAVAPGPSAQAQEACFEPIPGIGPCRQAANRHWNAMTGPFEKCVERDKVRSVCKWCVRHYNLAIRQCSLKLRKIPVEAPIDDCSTESARVEAAHCVIGGGFPDICGARYKMDVRECRAAAQPVPAQD